MPRGDNPNSRANLKPYTSEFRPKNPGRKPSKLRKYIKDNGITRDDVRLIMKETVFKGLNENDMKAILADTEKPMLIRHFVRAYLNDFKNGSMQNFNTFWTYVFGNEPQDINLYGSLTMSPEERDEKVKELLKKIKLSQDGQIVPVDED
jgi:hypothetical protein